MIDQTVFPRCHSCLLTEFACEMALVTKTVFEGDIAEPSMRINQILTGEPDTHPAQILLRRQMDFPGEFPFQRPDRPTRHLR